MQAAGNGILQLDEIIFDVLVVSPAGFRARGIREQFAAGPIDLLACHFHVLNSRAGEIFFDVTEYVLGCINRGEAISGPLDPMLCLTAQRIVDTAALSAREKRTLALVP